MSRKSKHQPLMQTIADNLNRLGREYDMSSHDWANRTGLPQRTCLQMTKADTDAKISTIEKLCDAMLISPATLMLRDLDTSVLMSRRVPRMIEAYNKLKHEQRDQILMLMDYMNAQNAKKELPEVSPEHKEGMLSSLRGVGDWLEAI